MELGFLQLMILEFMKIWYLNVILIFLNVILLNKIKIIFYLDILYWIILNYNLLFNKDFFLY